MLPPPTSRAEVEFRKWAKALAKRELTADQQRLLTLLLTRFSEMADLGTAHGRRAKWIVERWDTTASEDLDLLLSGAAGAAAATFPIKSLKTLTVGPFRGFSAEEILPLDRPVTFVYGPNGSGKSSLCEALEFRMLGFIEEAKAKRIELAEYVRHVPTGAYQAPSLSAIMLDDSEAEVHSNPDAFQFCFIEKNRIDSFARLTATTPAAQAHRIASLFGLEDFGQLVDGFTEVSPRGPHP